MKKIKGYRILLALMATLAVYLVGCTVPSGDVTAPTVTLVAPANLAVGAAINTKIVATFSEAMNPASISSTTFTVAQGATPVAGTVSSTATSATFTPSSVLLGGTTYTATITTGVKDVAGNALAVAYVWSFTTGTALDTTRPTVGSVLPLPSATAVAVNAHVSATFSEAMDPLSLTTASFTLKAGATAVAGAVTSAGTTATFTPTANLAASTLYTATVTTGVKDLAGNTLAVAYIWTFTTGTIPDTTAPTVSSTVPANAATGAAVNNSITATFSEAMAPLSITAATFTLKAGATAVPGVVTYVGTTATFNPTATLAGGTVYTATITTGATDIAGNALAANKVWTFTTVPVAVGPAPVLLGTSANFVILAETGVSTVPTSAITGNVGVSPAATSTLTGFALTLAGDHATAGQVVGNLYGANMTPPTPANLTTAVADMQTAYTDAAGRVTPDFLNLNAGNIGGQTLVAGLYNFGSTVVAPSSFTVSGGANDTWIFQISGDLTVANAVIVTLSGGAQAKNIFWQVAGQVTIGSTSQFKGIILSQTAITMGAGATLVGRALAQTAVNIDSSTITGP